MNADVLFSQRQYGRLIDLLSRQAQLAPREHALLGIALIRRDGGHGARLAEPHLVAASELGDDEAAVELGPCLLAQGRVREAVSQLVPLAEALEGELRYRALRWAGVALYYAGDIAFTGFMERAWRAYVALGDAQGRATVAFQHGLGLIETLQWDRAEALLRLGEAHFASTHQPWLRVNALAYLHRLFAVREQVDAATAVLRTLRRERPGVAPYYQLLVDMSEVEHARLQAAPAFVERLRAVWRQAHDTAHMDALLPLTAMLADEERRAGRVPEALAALHAFPGVGPNRPLALRAAEVMAVFQVDGSEATRRELVAVAGEAFAGGQHLLHLRLQLFLAEALRRAGAVEEAAGTLRGAFSTMLRAGGTFEARRDLTDLPELLAFALARSDLAPYVAAVGDGRPLQTGPTLTLRVLGRTQVFLGGRPVTFGRSEAPLALAYLALNPNRTADVIARALFPGRGPSGEEAVRNLVRALRSALGAEALVTERGAAGARGRYRLADDLRLDIDYLHLFEALRHGDLGALEASYRGPFLLDHPSPWTEETDAELRAMLGRVLREAVEGGGAREVVRAARGVLRRDAALGVAPDHELVEALRLAAERSGDEAALHEAGQFLEELGPSH